MQLHSERQREAYRRALASERVAAARGDDKAVRFARLGQAMAQSYSEPGDFAPPATYLAWAPGIGWQVIGGHSPVCAYTNTREQAEACARSLGIALPAEWWDGEMGDWRRA